MENNTNNTGNGAATSSEDASISTQATVLDKKEEEEEEEEEEEDGILGMMMMNEDEEEQEEPVLSNNSHDNKRDALYPFGDDVSPIGRQVMIKYEDNTYYPGTIRSYDPNGTYTIKWEDGSLQSSTLPEDIKWDVEQKKITTPAAVITETPVVVADELWLAARRGSIASVKRFVEIEKIHYDHDGGSGRTPFYWAVLCGHLQVTEFLISLGAKDPDGTAFAGASKPEMRELLKKNNLSPDSKKEVKTQNQEKEEEEEEEPIRIVDAEMGRKSIHRNSFAFPRRASITTTTEPEAIKSEDPKPVSIMNDVVPASAIIEKTQIVKTKTSSFNFTRIRLRLWDRFLLPFRRHRRDKKNP